MNDSGRAVQAAVQFYKLDLSDLVVLYDEIDLEFGKVRVKKGGGAAGHNGIRSIDGALGPDFWRVRLGVGHPGVKELVHGWVLSNFTAEEGQWLDPLLDAVADAAPLLIDDDPQAFMTKVATILNPPPPKPPRAPRGPQSGQPESE